MSYIHKALKKAQRNKDLQFQQYEGVLSSPRKKTNRFPGRTFWWVSVAVMVCLLAFASYSWFDSKGRHSPAAEKNTPEMTAKSPVKKPGSPAPVKKSVLKNRPLTDTKILYNRARAFHKTGRLSNARQLYQEVLKINPGYVDALNNLGVIYIHDRDYNAARVSFEKAIHLKPGNVDPYYKLACLYALMGKIKPSIAQFKKACSLDPEVKKWAQEDADLKNLRGIPEFEAMIER